MTDASSRTGLASETIPSSFAALANSIAARTEFL